MDLLEYDDYRAYFRAWYARARVSDCRISLGMLGLRLGISKMHVKHLLDGKRHASERVTASLARCIGLNGNASRYFIALANFNRVSGSAKGAENLRDLLSLRALMVSSIAGPGADDSPFSHWLVPIVLEMRSFPGFTFAPAWISERLAVPVRPAELHAAAEAARRWISSKDRPEAAANPMKLPDGFRSAIYSAYVRDSLDVARRLVDASPPDERETFNIVVSVPESRYRDAVARLRAFRNELHDLLANDDVCDRVVQVNCMLTTVSRREP